MRTLGWQDLTVKKSSKKKVCHWRGEQWDILLVVFYTVAVDCGLRLRAFHQSVWSNFISWMTIFSQVAKQQMKILDFHDPVKTNLIIHLKHQIFNKFHTFISIVNCFCVLLWFHFWTVMTDRVFSHCAFQLIY